MSRIKVAIAPTNKWAALFFASVLMMSRRIETVTTWHLGKLLPAFWHESYYRELKDANLRLYIGEEAIETPTRSIRTILIGENADLLIQNPEILQVEDWSGLFKVLDENVPCQRGNPRG